MCAFIVRPKQAGLLGGSIRHRPPALQDVLDRALQKNPIRRYRHAGELARDLRSCLKTHAA